MSAHTKLTQVPAEDIGFTDAFHVPVCVCKSTTRLEPGNYVKITKNFLCVSCNYKEADGVVTPFQDWQNFDEDKFYVMLFPNKTGEVHHTFELKLSEDKKTEALLEELKRCQEEDPCCSDCYVIEDGRIVRW